MRTMFLLCDDVLASAEKVVIPIALQERILYEFNRGHLRMSRMKALMRTYMYWLIMDRDIEHLVKKKIMQSCVLPAKAVQLQPETDKPWSRVHINCTEPVKGTYYFIIVDSFTKWSEVCRCIQLTSKAIIKFMQKMFCSIQCARYDSIEQWNIIYKAQVQEILKNACSQAFTRVHIGYS